MSGGRFDYRQYQLTDIYEDIENIIKNNKREYTVKELDEIYPYREPSWYEKYPEDKMMYNYPDEVIEKFKEAVKVIKQSQVYIQRVDWLLSGDDGDESFIKRLKEDLDKIENE